MELWLNPIGALTWEWRGWNAGAPWLIWLVGYMPFYVVAYWVHDMRSVKRPIVVVASLVGLVLARLGLFVGVLGWI